MASHPLKIACFQVNFPAVHFAVQCSVTPLSWPLWPVQCSARIFLRPSSSLWASLQMDLAEIYVKSWLTTFTVPELSFNTLRFFLHPAVNQRTICHIMQSAFARNLESGSFIFHKLVTIKLNGVACSNRPSLTNESTYFIPLSLLKYSHCWNMLIKQNCSNI